MNQHNRHGTNENYDQVFASARPLTPTESQEFVRWCKQRGILQIVAEMVKTVRIGTIKKAAASRLP